jgi:hypothetical protein
MEHFCAMAAGRRGEREAGGAQFYFAPMSGRGDMPQKVLKFAALPVFT